jgi:hypothetical protein
VAARFKMKHFLPVVLALLLAACGPDPRAMAAIEAMNLSDATGKVTYSSKSGAGKKFVFKDVTIDTDGENAIKINEVVFTGLTTTANGDPAFRTLRLSGLRPAADVAGLSVSLASIEITEPSEAVAVYIAQTISEAGADAPPPFADWAAASLTVRDFAMSARLDEMGAGTGSLSLTFAEAAIRRLDKTVFGEAAFKGLKGDFDIPADPAGGFPVQGTFDFGDLSLTGLRGALIANGFATGLAAAMDPIAAPSAGLFSGASSPIDPGYDAFKWSGAGLSVSGLDIAVSPIEASVTRNGEGVAIASKTPRATLSVKAQAQGGEVGAVLAGALGVVGYDNLEFYGAGETLFDPQSDTTRYQNAVLGLTDGFEMKASLTLLGLQDMMRRLTAVPETDSLFDAMTMLQGVRLADLELELTDASLTDRLLSLATLLGAADAETLRADLIALVEGIGPDLASAGAPADVVAAMPRAIADFIRKPGTLTFTLRPDAPIALDSLEALTPAGLGFSVSYAPPAK